MNRKPMIGKDGCQIGHFAPWLVGLQDCRDKLEEQATDSPTDPFDGLEAAENQV